MLVHIWCEILYMSSENKTLLSVCFTKFGAAKATPFSDGPKLNYIYARTVKPLRYLEGKECLGYACVLRHGVYNLLSCYYEGWNFNSGNYLFTNDTK